MNLSPHFTLQEMTRSNYDVENIPNALQIANMQLLCDNVLEPLRSHYGKPVIVTSGFRSAELNKLVGGAPNSQHTKGEAADIEIPGIRNDEVWNFIVNYLNFDQVIAERLKVDDGSAGWVHASYSINHNRREGLSCPAPGDYRKGLVYV